MIAISLLHTLLIANISPAMVGEPDATRVDAAMHRCVSRCSCVPGGNTKKALREADIVAHGTVLSIRSETPESYRRIVSIEIHTQWKPAVARDTIEVETGLGGGDCGYPFTVGTAYLVYAYQPEGGGRPVTGICSRTKLYKEAIEDIRELGRPIHRPTK